MTRKFDMLYESIMGSNEFDGELLYESQDILEEGILDFFTKNLTGKLVQYKNALVKFFTSETGKKVAKVLYQKGKKTIYALLAAAVLFGIIRYASVKNVPEITKEMSEIEDVMKSNFAKQLEAIVHGGNYDSIKQVDKDKNYDKTNFADQLDDIVKSK